MNSKLAAPARRHTSRARPIRLDIAITTLAASRLAELADGLNLSKCEALEWAIARAHQQTVAVGMRIEDVT